MIVPTLLSIIIAAAPTLKLEALVLLGEAPTPVVRASLVTWYEAVGNGRSLEFLGTRTQPNMQFGVVETGVVWRGDRVVALFVDRTGGCTRGLVRVWMEIPYDGRGEFFSSDDVMAPACTEPPTSLSYFLRFIVPLSLKSWREVASFVAADSLLKIASEIDGARTEGAYSKAQVESGATQLPSCDLLQDSFRCSQTSRDGTFRCTCSRKSQSADSARSRSVEFDLRLSSIPRQDTIELVSINEQDFSIRK